MSEENSTNTILKIYDPANYDPTNYDPKIYDPKIYDESLIKQMCNLGDPRVINQDEKIKFKFANNKKAIEYNFKSAESNDFTLGISNTSSWSFAPKQQEQKMYYLKKNFITCESAFKSFFK
jgi:hypothetical protein